MSSSRLPPSHVQVLVIGGGPAGSYAAAALAREGIDVAVLEAAKFPRYHVGESLIPSIRHYLRFIDAEEKLSEYGFVRKPGSAIKFNQFKREGYTDFVTLGHNNNAWNVVRSEFDQMLLNHAQECGASVYELTRVNSIQFSATDPSRPSSASWTHTLSPESSSEGSATESVVGTTSFTHIIDASGRAGILSTSYLKNRHFNASLKNIAVWGYWRGVGTYGVGTPREGAPWFEALTDESGWGWFIPLHNGITSVGIVMNQKVYNKKSKREPPPSALLSRVVDAISSQDNTPISVLMIRYLSNLSLAPGILKLIGSGVLVSKDLADSRSAEPVIRSASDFSYSAQHYAGNGYRIVGDAGAFIDPFFSSGVHLALTSALSAASTICASLRADCSEKEAADWHTKRVSTSYTRFQVVVLSAYKQIRAQCDNVLSDINEDNYDRAFSLLRPVIQGASDMGARLSETELQKSLDFCVNFFNPTSPEQHEHVSQVKHLGVPTQMGAPSRSASVSSIPPPPPPPKDAIRSREEMVLEKRRQARRQEEDESQGYYTPPKTGLGRRSVPAHLLAVVEGRPSRRRSMSTGDVEELSSTARRRGEALLDVATFAAEEDPLADSIDRELRKLERSPSKKSKYLAREQEGMIYASSDADRISHMDSAGDVDGGKAWRTVRRPSDMNEYSKQIKEFRAQEKPGKAHGKVFGRVLGIKAMNVPLPQNPTTVSCTLNNGIHFVTTSECRFGPDCSVEQEFELIEHNKLEFTLTLKVRRDPHIIAQFKALSHSLPAPAPAPPKGGMRSFFSSPKKSSKEKTPPQPPQRLPENLARYLKPDGTLARAFISFKDIAGRCDTRLFETSYPLIGQRTEVGNAVSTLQVGEIVLQLFRLPPLPGISPSQLPQSLEECHRGLRHINWHKVTYFEGTLTQNGGDCTSWRRRQLRVIGANLVAFNDVTRKATAAIDLRKAIAIEDDQDMRENLLSPSSQSTSRSRFIDEYDGLYGVERSFRLIFPQDQEILFFADNDEEKAKWLEVLRALVGHIPPHPLWAELLWQRQDELSKRSQA